jgi:hypothetical protein
MTVPRGGLIVPSALRPRGITGVRMPTAPTSIHATRSDADGGVLGGSLRVGDDVGVEGDDEVLSDVLTSDAVGLVRPSDDGAPEIGAAATVPPVSGSGGAGVLVTSASTPADATTAEMPAVARGLRGISGACPAAADRR